MLVTRKMLSEELLDQVHDNVNINLIDTIAIYRKNDRATTLLQGGWSSNSNCPLIASSVFIGEKSFLLDAQECGLQKKPAEY